MRVVSVKMVEMWQSDHGVPVTVVDSPVSCWSIRPASLVSLSSTHMYTLAWDGLPLLLWRGTMCAACSAELSAVTDCIILGLRSLPHPVQTLKDRHFVMWIACPHLWPSTSQFCILSLVGTAINFCCLKFSFYFVFPIILVFWYSQLVMWRINLKIISEIWNPVEESQFAMPPQAKREEFCILDTFWQEFVIPYTS